MFEIARLYVFAFGVFTVAGGVIGFVKAKSTASLVAGGLAGALLVVSGYLVGVVGRNGLILGHVVSLALAIRFVSAFRKTRKIIPAGIMAVLGGIGVVLTAACLLH